MIELTLIQWNHFLSRYVNEMAIPEFVNIATLNKKLRKSWSRGFVKSRQKNGRDSRSRETEVGEKIAVTTTYLAFHVGLCV